MHTFYLLPQCLPRSDLKKEVGSWNPLCFLLTDVATLVESSTYLFAIKR